MTITPLTDGDIERLVRAYQSKKFGLKFLANSFHLSETRTRRILIEQGVYAPQERRTEGGYRFHKSHYRKSKLYGERV